MLLYLNPQQIKMDYKKLRTLIITTRRGKGHNQKSFARLLGKKQTTYSYIENNLDKAPWKVVQSILKTLDLHIIVISGEQLKSQK